MKTEPTAIATVTPHDTTQIEQEILSLAVHIAAATYRLLTLLVQYDLAQNWAQGFLSCAHWMNWRLHISLSTAREHLRVGHALQQLPQLSAAFEQGQLSFSQTRALTRIATPENEGELMSIAKATTASQLEKIVRLMRKCSAQEEVEKETMAFQRRELTTFFDDNDGFIIRGRLTKEQGAVIQKALELDLDQQFNDGSSEQKEKTTSAQRRADALFHMAQSALDHRMQQGTPAEQTQVVVHVDAKALSNPEAEGMSTLDNKIRVSAETSRRLSCDASVVLVKDDENGNPLWSGRKQRVISSALRRVLLARDRHCSFPGCTHERHLVGHHIHHWADGGTTDPDNIVLLCPQHHHAVHEGGVQLTRSKTGELCFVLPSGTQLKAVAEIPQVEADLVQTLVDMNPDVSAENLSCWDGDRVDYDWIITGFFEPRCRLSSPCTP